MEQKYNHKKRNILIGVCVAAGVCLTGIVAAAALIAQRNPLAKGLSGLAEEILALEAELGEGFWTDAVNQICSENIQAEYSVNIGGIPETENITVGMDGIVRRDMEKKLLETEAGFSVANAELTEASLFGTADTLYLQVPSVWEGSVVLDGKNVSGQWNDSAVKKELQLLAGQEFKIPRRVDAELFQSFSINSFSAAAFWEENSETLTALYQSMEVIKVGKAQREEMLSAEQAESLEKYELKNVEEKQVASVCYLVILPEKELKEIFPDLEGDIRLGVYLDEEKRIVRICTLPGEKLVTDVWTGSVALNLMGIEATTDRLELESTGIMNVDKMFSSLHDEEDTTFVLPDTAKTEGNIILEKDRDTIGSYRVECSVSESDGQNVRELSFEAGIQGERAAAGEQIALEVENLVLKSQSMVVCRGSGRISFAPLTEEVRMPSGKEYRISEMNELEAALFLAECTKNVYENYSGYMRLMRS